MYEAQRGIKKVEPVYAMNRHARRAEKAQERTAPQRQKKFLAMINRIKKHVKN